MTTNQQTKRKARLAGTAVFLTLIVYFNLRSPGPRTVVDWMVITVAALLFVFALVRWFQGRTVNS